MIMIIDINDIIPPKSMGVEMGWKSPIWHPLGNPNRIDKLIRIEGYCPEDFPPLKIESIDYGINKGKYRIIDGCHRFLGFKLMGYKKLECVVLE